MLNNLHQHINQGAAAVWEYIAKKFHEEIEANKRIKAKRQKKKNWENSEEHWEQIKETEIEVNNACWLCENPKHAAIILDLLTGHFETGIDWNEDGKPIHNLSGIKEPQTAKNLARGVIRAKRIDNAQKATEQIRAASKDPANYHWLTILWSDMENTSWGSPKGAYGIELQNPELCHALREELIKQKIFHTYAASRTWTKPRIQAEHWTWITDPVITALQQRWDAKHDPAVIAFTENNLGGLTAIAAIHPRLLERLSRAEKKQIPGWDRLHAMVAETEENRPAVISQLLQWKHTKYDLWAFNAINLTPEGATAAAEYQPIQVPTDGTPLEIETAHHGKLILDQAKITKKSHGNLLGLRLGPNNWVVNTKQKLHEQITARLKLNNQQVAEAPFPPTLKKQPSQRQLPLFLGHTCNHNPKSIHEIITLLDQAWLTPEIKNILRSYATLIETSIELDDQHKNLNTGWEHQIASLRCIQTLNCGYRINPAITARML